MASRRTRIKGIANIPQRKKNVEGKHTDNGKELEGEGVEVKKDEKLDDSCVVNKVAENSEIGDNNKKEDNPTPPATKNEDSTISDASKTVQNAIPAVRRKFLKPKISASIVNRKPKLNADVKDTELSKSTEESENGPVADIATIPSVVEQGNEKRKTTNLTSSGEITLNETRLLPQETFKAETEESQRKINPLLNNTEPPPPPPSPSKVNRLRIKAVPRIGCRKTSFSASESEDESRKHTNRIRNDSVCSTASLAADADALSSQKAKEPVAHVPKKSVRAEQTRKIAEARRDFQRRFGSNKPDKQKLRMMDLIFYNPDTNPMSEPNRTTVILPNTQDSVMQDADEDDPQATQDSNKSDEENEMPVPQIKIGLSGEIILDERSLVVERKEVRKQREKMEKQNLVNGDLDTSYGIYTKAKKSKYWTNNETLRFYKALNNIGTDFTLMCDLFPNRTRRELKLKFHKEERINRDLVDKALLQPCNFEFDELKHEMEMEEKEQEEVQRQKEEALKLKKERAERNRKRKAEKLATPPESPPSVPAKTRKPRRPKLSIKDVLDSSNSDADESDVATQDESDEETVPLQKPTRSGRIPKLTQKFTNNTDQFEIDDIVVKRNKLISENPPNSNQKKIEPGSIMVFPDKGPNDEPIYKLYMVTPENTPTPLQINSDTFSKALQKGIISAENILTISANVTDNEEESEENNLTIPADENVTSLKTTEKDKNDKKQTDQETHNEAVATQDNQEGFLKDNTDRSS